MEDADNTVYVKTEPSMETFHFVLDTSFSHNKRCCHIQMRIYIFLPLQLKEVNNITRHDKRAIFVTFYQLKEQKVMQKIFMIGTRLLAIPFGFCNNRTNEYQPSH